MTTVKRAVSVLEVAEPAVWAELEARVPLAAHVGEALGPTRRVALPSFDKEVMPKLEAQGQRVLVRYARRAAAEIEAATHALEATIAGLPEEARRVLHAAQHHALDGIVLGAHAWDPEADAPSIRVLHGAGLLDDLPEEPAPPSPSEPHPHPFSAARGPVRWTSASGDAHLPPARRGGAGCGYDGRYRLHPDLPPPPAIPYDWSDAVMDETEDLDAPKAGPVGLLHDLASLAAAIEQTRPHRTHAGTIAKADEKKLAARLGAKLDKGLEADDRWGRALRGLEALKVVSMDPFERELHLDLGLETTLTGDTPDAVDQLVHRLVEPDLHGVVPAVREALRQAGEGALDELVWMELLREQHREVIFPAWKRGGKRVYPLVPGEPPRPYDDDGWEDVETPMLRALLVRLTKLGLLRRAPGVIAATADGRVWARAKALPTPPVWLTGDLELMVPPDSVTPWERFQLERLGRCLSRDVVDRYRLERKNLETWLSTHDVEEALALLRRRCPGVPATVEDTLRTWASSALRVVLVRGVVLEGP